MVGLFTTYFLSCNPLNKVIVLERNKQTCLGTSEQNACWFAVDYASNWGKKPLYPWAYKGLFDYDEHVTKTYKSTLISSWPNLLITAK